MKIAPFGSLRRGFTLIELLVVIAIIGILSSVVLASLNTARDKGTDAKIQSEIRSIQVNAEIYYDNNGNSYGTAADCNTGIFANTSNPNIKQIVDDLKVAHGTADPQCYATTAAYAVRHQLKANSALFFCADSTGKVGTSTVTAIGTTGACP